MKDEVKLLRSEAAELAKKYKRLEKTLQHTQDRFQRIFHASSNMMTITTVKGGRIIDMNESSASLGGFIREELIGTLSAENSLWADAKQREEIVQILKKEGKVHNREVSFLAEDGSVHRVLFSADPIIVNGESCLLGTSVDITAKEKEADAVRRSEEQYRMLVENSLLGVTISQDDCFVFCNPAFAQMSGYSIDELLSFPGVNAVIHPGDREMVQGFRSERMAGKPDRRRFEFRLIRKDREERLLETYAGSIEYNGKSATQCTHLDITERRQTENALRESEEKLRLMTESIDEVFWVFDIEQQAMTYASPAHERVWGYPRDLFADLRKPFLDPIHPEDRELVLNHISMLKSGQVLDFAHRFTCPDGEMRYLHHRGFPVLDKSGKPRLYIGVGKDITESRKAQESLRKSREYLDRILNSTSDGIFVKDREYRFVHVNDAFCAFRGQQREDLLGKTGFEELPEEKVKSIIRQEEEVLKTGREILGEETFPGAQGNPSILMIKRSLLTDQRGNRQIVAIGRNITQYRQLEAQFLQAQKMEAIGVLAGGVAHDFNNLLNVINGYSELILDQLAAENPIRKDIERIRDAGKRAADLTSQLLAFGRKQILQPELLDVNHVIVQMSSMLRRLIGEDIEFIVSARPDLGLIHADPGQIQQAVMNLAINARDAMPLGGRLVIETANVSLEEPYMQQHPMVPAGPYIMLAISDNGVGIDEITRAHLFEPFFTTKQKGKATGLGLSTVYGIVKQSNGFIWVYSEPGKGTTFKLYFPQAEGSLAGRKKEGSTLTGIRGSETVLLVEDEQAIKELAGRILRDQGYNVLEASNGAEALRISREFAGQIHLIVTDVAMPDFSGKALVSQLETTRPGIKALYVSGYTDDSIVHSGILDSHVAFLQKPFTGEGLIRKVREVLNS